jgi:L-fuconolactonase
VAVRHVVQDEPSDDFILGSTFNEGVGLLARHGLAYDILVVERQLPQAIRFADRHPDLQLVLDHCAKPRIAAGEAEPWRTNIRELAKRPNVACKISGLVTEADPRKDLRAQCLPYVETALEAFGPDRCMFGSDWPVCLLACGYALWHGILSGYASALSRAEQDGLFGLNAERIYRLPEVR